MHCSCGVALCIATSAELASLLSKCKQLLIYTQSNFCHLSPCTYLPLQKLTAWVRVSMLTALILTRVHSLNRWVHSFQKRRAHSFQGRAHSFQKRRAHKFCPPMMLWLKLCWSEPWVSTNDPEQVPVYMNLCRIVYKLLQIQ